MFLPFANSRRATALKILPGVALALAGVLTSQVVLIVVAALVLGTIALRSLRSEERGAMGRPHLRDDHRHVGLPRMTV